MFPHKKKSQLNSWNMVARNKSFSLTVAKEKIIQKYYWKTCCLRFRLCSDMRCWRRDSLVFLNTHPTSLLKAFLNRQFHIIFRETFWTEASYSGDQKWHSGAAWLVGRRGSVGSASACCKAGPSSILGSAPQRSFPHWAHKRWGYGERLQRMATDVCIVIEWMYVCYKKWKINKKSGILPPNQFKNVPYR